jgi:hypothetical protein
MKEQLSSPLRETFSGKPCLRIDTVKQRAQMLRDHGRSLIVKHANVLAGKPVVLQLALDQARPAHLGRRPAPGDLRSQRPPALRSPDPLDDIQFQLAESEDSSARKLRASRPR